MEQKNEKYILIVMAGLFLAFIAFFGIKCASWNNLTDYPFRFSESDYFIYITGTKNNEINIVGLTDEGKQQEYLVIPSEIDGKKVRAVGSGMQKVKPQLNDVYGGIYGGIISENLKRLYVNADVYWELTSYINAPELACVSVIPVGGVWGLRMNELTYPVGSTEPLYVVPVYAIADSDKYIYNQPDLIYSYNFEGAGNDGYYWIDNYNYGEKIEYIPAAPERSGYIFGGWYKEAECINEWDFDKDTLPSEKSDEENNVIFQLTVLYAKWIKN